jgi:hypothetical protein
MTTSFSTSLRFKKGFVVTVMGSGPSCPGGYGDKHNPLIDAMLHWSKSTSPKLDRAGWSVRLDGNANLSKSILHPEWCRST